MGVSRADLRVSEYNIERINRQIQHKEAISSDSSESSEKSDESNIKTKQPINIQIGKKYDSK